MHDSLAAIERAAKQSLEDSARRGQEEIDRIARRFAGRLGRKLVLGGMALGFGVGLVAGFLFGIAM